MTRIARRALSSVTYFVAVATLAWWWWTFFYVVGYGYLSWREAASCLVSDNDICALAKVLCLGSHPRPFPPYWTAAFWSGAALLSLNLWFKGGRAA